MSSVRDGTGISGHCSWSRAYWRYSSSAIAFNACSVMTMGAAVNVPLSTPHPSNVEDSRRVLLVGSSFGSYPPS